MSSLLMAHNIMVISMNKVKEFMKDNKCGKMVSKLSPPGCKIFLMDLEYLSAPMDSHSKASGIKESYKAMENIMAKMAPMKETGETTNHMDMEYKPGPMEALFQATITKASNTGKENIHGQTNPHMTEIGSMDRSMEREFIIMLTAEYMKGNLRTIKCKEKAFTHGQMEESTSGVIKTTRSTD